MTTVDNLLLKITNTEGILLENKIPSKEARILHSLANSINTHLFITENQSKLLSKILHENSEKLQDFSNEIKEALSDPTWSKPFRHIEEVKKMYISEENSDSLHIVVEFSFNAKTRAILQEVAKKCENLYMESNGKKYVAELTEQNVVVLVDTLTPLNFEISETILSHYNTIKSWSETEIHDKFLITNIEHKNFQKSITDDLGLSTIIDQNIIHDRSIRYQYHLDTPRNIGENLTEYISNRTKTRIYIDKKQHSMTEVVHSLISIKRLPILVVFDTLVSNKYLENLKLLSNALIENGISDKIGVYFRLSNDESGKQFNQFISDNLYNYNLTDDTNVACVASGKLPKFFLKTAWKPMSIIALDSRMGMRHGKTAVYSNCCDLIIEWADEPSVADLKVIKK
jgi:hypothetical protein